MRLFAQKLLFVHCTILYCSSSYYLCISYLCISVSNRVVYLNFGSPAYSVYEDHEGPWCIELTLDKPAVFEVTVVVIDFGGTATSKLCNYYFIWNMNL